VKDVKERIKELKERRFEHDMLELEETALQILAGVKQLRWYFLAYEEGEVTEIDVKDVARELANKITHLHRAYGDLEEWIKEILESE